MNCYKLADAAKEDLLEIGEYLEQENPAAVARLLQMFRNKFQFLAQFPQAGRERNDMLLYLRTFPAGKYIIFYQLADYGIEVLRVRHSAQDNRDLFDYP